MYLEKDFLLNKKNKIQLYYLINWRCDLMKKTAIFLMLATIISKTLGFLRDITLSYFYGASGISDAYLISLTVPSVIFSFIGIGLSTGYIPLYSIIDQKHGEKESNKYTNNLINILFLICTVIFIIGQVFTGQIVRLFASGFEGEILLLAIRFTKISLLGIYFTGIIYIFKGFLQLKNSYIIPSLISIPFNIIIIASIFLSSKINVMALSVGSVIAIISQLIMLVPLIYKRGYKYQFIIDVKDKYIKKMMYIALPVIIGSSINQINILVDRTIASNISVGGISALNYSNKLNAFIQGLFVTSIVTVMYPMISKMAAEKNINGLKKSVSEAISSINLLIIPITVGSMIFTQPIVRLLFGRGAFNDSAIIMTSNALFFYSIGMLGFGLREILSRAFYSMQDTKTPMINATIAVVINIILNIILSRFMGIGGLALATSISALICTGLLFISLKRKIGRFGMKNIIISFIKIVISSLVMGIVSKISFDLLLKNGNENLSLVIAVGIGALTYALLIYFMKVEEVNVMINSIKRKFGKKQIGK